jgi:parallel beta-helix repeat protein
VKKYKSAIIIIFLVIALPLFVWALVKLNFNQNKKAASGEPIGCTAVDKVINVTASQSEGNNPNDTGCHDLQAAIDSVTGDGFKIIINPGEYWIYQSILITDKTNLTITGVPEYGNGSTILNLMHNPWGFLIQNSSGSLEWLTIKGGSSNGMLSIKGGSSNYSLGYININSDSSHTIDIYDSSNISIYNSDISSSAGAIEVGHVTDLNISNNKIHNSANALVVRSNSSNINIVGNLIRNNYENGIGIEMSDNSNISHNSIVKNGGIGINLYGAGNINLSNNLITNNTGSGIYAKSPITGSSIINKNDVWSNAGGNYGNMSDPTGTDGNISSNPLLNNLNNLYCLNSGSPAILLNGEVLDFMGYIGSCSNVPAETPNPTYVPSPTPNSSLSPINWTTSDISITADDFFVTSNNKKYTGESNYITYSQNNISNSHKGLEVISNQYGDTLKLFIDFRIDGSTWDVSEVKILNSNVSPNNWVSYPGPFIYTTLGYAHTENGTNTFGLVDSSNGQTILTVNFTNLRIQAFTNSTPPPTACPNVPFSLNINPEYKSGEPGDTIRYAVTVTNNDSTCGPLHANMIVDKPSNWIANFTTQNFVTEFNTPVTTYLDVTSPTSSYGIEEQPIAIRVTTVNTGNQNSKTVIYNLNLPSSPTPKFADINNDGIVNIIDIGIAIDLYDSSSPSNPRADINGDGIVSIIDIGFIIDNYEW